MEAPKFAEYSTESQKSGALKRKEREILQPNAECFEKIGVKSTKGENVFFLRDTSEVLGEMLRQQSVVEKSVFDTHRSTHQHEHVLRRSNSRKCSQRSIEQKIGFVYVAFREMGNLISPAMWYPIAAIPCRDLATISGGLSTVWSNIMDHLLAQMSRPIMVSGQRRSLKLQHVIADYEGLVCFFSGLGAAASKPCILRKNIVSSRSDVPSHSSYFRTIEEADPKQFDLITAEDLHSTFDTLLVQAVGLCKTRRKALESSFGFHIISTGILANPIARSCLSVDKAMMDSCHCYYANGVVASEITLYQSWMEDQFSIGYFGRHCQICRLS